MKLFDFKSGNKCILCDGFVIIENQWNDFFCNKCGLYISLYNGALYSFHITLEDFYIYCSSTDFEYSVTEESGNIIKIDYPYLKSDVFKEDTIFSLEDLFNQDLFNIDFIRRFILNKDLM